MIQWEKESTSAAGMAGGIGGETAVGSGSKADGEKECGSGVEAKKGEKSDGGDDNSNLVHSYAKFV